MTESLREPRDPRQRAYGHGAGSTAIEPDGESESSEQLVDRLVLALEGTEVGVWEYCVSTGEIWFSDSLVALQGYDRDEALRLGDFPDPFISMVVEAPQYVHPDDLPLLSDARQRILSGGIDIIETEHRMLHRQGHWVWISQRCRVVERDRQGAPTRLVGIRADISRRRKAQDDARERRRELETTKHQLDLAMEAANLGIWTWDLESRVGRATDSAQKMCGMTEGPLLNLRQLSNFVHPADFDELIRRFGKRSAEGNRIEREFRAVMPDGSIKHLYCVGALAPDDEAKRTLTGIVLDVSERKKAELQLSIAESELNEAQIRAFRYQVNPHFLFNTLSSIATLILDGRALEAEEMVLRLAAFYRSSLQRDPLQKVSLREEIELQRLYLSIEKVRFPDEIDVAFDIPPELESCFVPCLLLQPMIENSIKFGLRSAGSMMKIEVRARVEKGQLLIEVLDDGRGSGAPKGTGAGLRITERRLAAAYGDDYRFQAGPRHGGGFEVAIQIPMECESGSLPLTSEHQALLSIARRLQAIIGTDQPPAEAELARIQSDLDRALARSRTTLRRTSRKTKAVPQHTGEFAP